MSIIGTSGDDIFTGTSGGDFFDMSQGGNDSVSGLGSNDIFNFGAAFTVADSIDGGAGVDALVLNGDYSGANHIVFDAATMVNVEQIKLDAGHSYSLQLVDANIAAGQTLTVNGTALGASDALTFYDATETNGNIILNSGAGNDTITGGGLNNTINTGAGNDTVYSFASGTVTINAGDGNDAVLLQAAGHVTVNGGAGNDTFNALGHFTAANHFDGGADSDELDLSGNYSAGLVFTATTMTNVETLFLGQGGDYKITLNDANVAAGHHLDADGDLLQVGDTMIFNASKETDATLFIGAGDGNDTLTGGQDGNTFLGGMGHDALTAGAGDDVFQFNAAAESTGITRDVVKGFDALHDGFKLPAPVSGIDAAINTGTLTGAHFDSDLAAAVDGSHLAAGHAVLFSPNAGGYVGHTFLVVDENGAVGYQAGVDLVVDLVSATHLASLALANFT